jgi:short-subunit dehydrogenase
MNSVALITGASSGIGYELAHIHAKTGNDLILVARRKHLLLDLKTQLELAYGIKVYVIESDLSLPNAARFIYDEIKRLNIPITYLINNAGFGGQGYFHEQDLSFQLNMMHVNMVALTELTYYVLTDFIKQGFGKILNTSSIVSLMPGPLQIVYYATKAYVQSFSLGLAGELIDYKNITVTALMPGPTNTGFEKASNLEKTTMYEKAFSAKKVAEVGYKAMLKGKLQVLTGVTFGRRLSLKMLPFLPIQAKLSMIKNMQTNTK